MAIIIISLNITSSLDRRDPCLSGHYCKNGATCISRPDLEINHFTCICRMRFTGKLCEIEVNELAHNNTLIFTKSKNVDDDLMYELTSTNSAKSSQTNRCLDENMNPCFDKV